ncbi:hypothetical protein KAR91_15015 [Candidatus Pacearchaeota archaeon]|nr:hypothetical protein [Candidatus Pacearchaeota archaeon]
MKTCTIAIDPHKLKVFERMLTEAGYSYTKHLGSSLHVLKVEVEDVKYMADRALLMLS